MMTEKKLIVPAELPLCGTCSFWEGERVIDEEAQLVILKEESLGQCLVEEKSRKALQARAKKTPCIWEDLNSGEEKAASESHLNHTVLFHGHS